LIYLFIKFVWFYWGVSVILSPFCIMPACFLYEALAWQQGCHSDCRLNWKRYII